MEKINSKLEEQKLQTESTASNASLVSNIIQQVNGSDISNKINIDAESPVEVAAVPTDFYQVINTTENNSIQLLKASSLKETYANTNSKVTNTVKKSEVINGDIDDDALTFIEKIKKQRNRMKNVISDMFESMTSMIDSLFNGSGKTESLKSRNNTEDS